MDNLTEETRALRQALTEEARSLRESLAADSRSLRSDFADLQRQLTRIGWTLAFLIAAAVLAAVFA